MQIFFVTIYVTIVNNSQVTLKPILQGILSKSLCIIFFAKQFLIFIPSEISNKV
jgi:hypothetical protein